MKRLLLLLVLLLPASAWAQGVRRSDIVLGPRGTPVPSVTVAVCTQPANVSTTPCSPLATLTIDSIAAISRSSNNVTVTTSSSHALVAGFTVTIAGVSDASFNGTFPIAGVPSPTTFTYAQTAPNGSSSGGTVSQPNPLTGDALGNYYFYGLPGRYTVQVYSPQIQTPFVQTDVLLPCDPSNPGATGCGTVGSVALTMPPEFSVSGSPVTVSGTLAVSKANQNANQVYAGPSSGPAAAPTFRALVPADLPIFGASGASHSAGAVPDPGSTAGTTRFLREDATWAAASGGVTEALWPLAAFTAPSLVCSTGNGGTQCGLTIFVNAHTLTRLVYTLTTSPAGCTTAGVIGVKDLTSNSNVSSLTIANGAAVGMVDSGALSAAMTAGHTFGIGTLTAEAGCTTNANYANLIAVYQ